MRCWRNALDEILSHHSSKVLPNYTPRSETEAALVDSLLQLELQCKERIDLLEALRMSRQEAPRSSTPARSAAANFTSPPNMAVSSPTSARGWIGQGTIPAATYPELSRPALPSRPSLPNRTSSERAVVSGNASGSGSGPEAGVLPSPGPARTHSANNTKEKMMRSPSPEKHTMRTTLRSARPGEKTTKLSRKSAKPEGPGASKAATLAWSALTSKDRLLRGLGSGSDSVSPSASPRQSNDQPKKGAGVSPLQWDIHTRRLVTPRDADAALPDGSRPTRHSEEFSYDRPSALSVSAASSALNSVSIQESPSLELATPRQDRISRSRNAALSVPAARAARKEGTSHSDIDEAHDRRKSTSDSGIRRKAVGEGPKRADPSSSSGQERDRPAKAVANQAVRRPRASSRDSSASENSGHQASPQRPTRRRPKGKRKEDAIIADTDAKSSDGSDAGESSPYKTEWKNRKKAILKNLPPGVDEGAAKQILNEIVVKGDEVHWSDVAGLEIAKNALREAVVYPFLRPDLFMGLREPARGMLLFGPPGTGKTMLARAVATESRSTFFSISASSLTSKYLGESEKLVRALFSLAKELAPSIIFVDEIDSLLSQRSGSGEHEATRRIKTEFLIQWSDLQRAAAGRAPDELDKSRGDANRVLVLAATNLPWAIDEAARRRFVRRQYIPLPEPETRSTQLRTLLSQQKHGLSDYDVEELVTLTDGFSGSDITALAKDAAMGPLRSLGEALLHMTMDDIRPISIVDFKASLTNIRPSVSKTGLKEYEDWAQEFGERGG
ncbi:SAP1 [Verticillium dahliae VdLs.17]|uniref:SAP1 n=4 Tax=Verticillium TaxID=1036719 RepID=G2XGZ2_VERDV|nr:SAP1 [Verticillium dahliae VdLs.17]EGY19090.1 SAP1 [Verticillium dahliae VdLs.17]